MLVVIPALAGGETGETSTGWLVVRPALAGGETGETITGWW